MAREARRTSDLTLETLLDLAPWQWPEGAGDLLVGVLRDARSTEPDLQTATELAGEFVVLDDAVVGALLSVLQNSGKSEAVRHQAAISLGPALEHTDVEGFSDPEEIMIRPETFEEVKQVLKDLYEDPETPKYVRRGAFEASVRALQDWHADAIRTAYASGDRDWTLTAVFGMRFVRGFEKQILEALRNKDEEIHAEAVQAAGAWEIDAAWDHVAALVRDERTPKDLRLAAIEAVASIRPGAAAELLEGIGDSADPDIVEAVEDALVMAVGAEDYEDEDEGSDGEEADAVGPDEEESDAEEGDEEETGEDQEEPG